MIELKGAEATIEIREDRVVKTRLPKKYRHPDIDSEIRRERTSSEKRIIDHAIKHGVNAPETEKTGENVLEMQKISGNTLRDILEEKAGKAEELGKNVAYLHSADIIHGDLTTSNVLVNEDVYLIDFGLSFRSDRVEDKAVDIHLLKQVLNSSHPEKAETVWRHFLDGYSSYEEYEEVMSQLSEVEKRGRYK